MASHPDPLIAHFISLGLVDEQDIPLIEGLLQSSRATAGLTVDEHDLLGVSQALGRAVERVAAAGADVAVRQLDALPPDERAARLEDWLEHSVTTTTSAFGLLYARRLRRAAERRLHVSAAANHPSPPLYVAFVDLRGSTAFMLGASAGQIEQLADDLYAVGQAAAAHHEVQAGKFLGDGVLLISADRENLLNAAVQTVVELAERTPLRAGAGVAHGPVIRRAGDWHGPPVNLAARLSELAAADVVLVDDEAVGERPADGWREVVPRGLTEPRRVAVLRPQ